MQYKPIPIFQKLEKEDLIQNIYPYETTDHLLVKYEVKKRTSLRYTIRVREKVSMCLMII